MSRLFNALIIFIFLVSTAVAEPMKGDDLPADTKWYLHVDLKQMRESSSGRDLYNWLDGEVFMEIHDDIGIDIGKEADRLTAFSGIGKGTIIVLEGAISKASQDKVLALAAVEAKLDARSHKGKTYYRLEDDGKKHEVHGGHSGNNIAFDGLDDEAFFSFAVPGKLIVASTDKELEALLDSGGKVVGSGSHTGALFVLTADKTFVQAGLKTDDMDDEDGGWRSNIVRNTEQVALLVSESNDHIAVQAQLVSVDPLMAESIGGIINGLISLQAFNTELDPEIRTLIQNTRIQVKEKVLTISTVIDPKTVVQVLND
jgi:hypothetical protein